MSQWLEWLALVTQRGGVVMYPLFAVSVVSLALILERAWFWLAIRRSAGGERLLRLNDSLRRGDRRSALRLIKRPGSPYDRVAQSLLEHGATEAVAIEAVQHQRPRFERFMVTLSTIITAAPLLGILGTVIGIIRSFNLLGEQSALTDPRDISGGIAEALLTTALGLIIALFTLFPYMIFRGEVDRAMGKLESLIAAAQQGQRSDSQEHSTQAARESAIGSTSDGSAPQAVLAGATAKKLAP